MKLKRVFRSLIFVACFLVLFAASFMIVLASNFDYAVPFTTQAPFGNWNYPYQGYCEEADAVMAAHYLWKIPITSNFADLEMNITRQYENFRWNKYDNTSTAETVEFMKIVYGFSGVKVIKIYSPTDIINFLNNGYILIVPTAARLLHNSHYTGIGPIYHMVLIRGYDSDSHEFITNDPGFFKGNGYHYSYEVLFNAIHDWNNGDVLNGEQNVILISVK